MPGILTLDESKLDPNLFIGDSKVYADTTSLDRDLVAMANKTLLEDIPLEHLRGHSRLQKILRGTTYAIRVQGFFKFSLDPGEWANWFSADDQSIVINIPLKMKRAYKSMSKAVGDKIWSKAMGGCFWARDRKHRRTMTDLILPWAFRHELGHSIDYLTQFMNRHGARPEFGGWVAYIGNDDPGGSRDRQRAMVQDVLTGVCRERGELRRSVDECAQATRAIVGFVSQEERYSGKKHRAAIKAKIAEIKDPRLRRHMERVWEVIAAGAEQPWLTGSLMQMFVVDGRVYSYNMMDGAWFSFSASAYRERVSNYQFASPAEWFAEYYSARYAAKTGPAMYKTLRECMRGDTIAEIDDILRGDCDATKRAIKPFRWSDVANESLTAKRLKYVQACIRGRRSDGTFLVEGCTPCGVEWGYTRDRLRHQNTLLHANVLCGTCSPALRDLDILSHEVKPLCAQCSAQVDASPKLKLAWAYLRDTTKTAIVRCSKDHWTPTPKDVHEGLIPCPWYDT